MLSWESLEREVIFSYQVVVLVLCSLIEFSVKSIIKRTKQN